MHFQTHLLTDHEDRLMRKTLAYAKQQGFTEFTSTLEEAWRLSISGITASIVAGAEIFTTVPELTIHDAGKIDPLTEFGVIEARRHRTRGITIGMFLGLLKYYRQSYLDLIAELLDPGEAVDFHLRFIHRCFDRIEIAFCREWTETDTETLLSELQTTARQMTNEKNVYLTVFESLSDPVIILDTAHRIINLNNAASLLADPRHIPGGHYYRGEPTAAGTESYGKQDIDNRCLGKAVLDVFPKLEATLFSLTEGPTIPREVCICVNGDNKIFEVKRSALLDLSEKLTGTIIICRDITLRKQSEGALKKSVNDLAEALSQVKRLSGLLPICAGCKKVRDDKGYWSQVEQYISDRSDATFSHGICPECFEKHYPELVEKAPFINEN